MKLIKNLIFISLIIMASACSSDDDAQPPINRTFLKAKVNGVHYESKPEETNAIFRLTEELVPFLAIQGDDGEGNIIQIQVAEFYTIGTYEIGEDSSPNFLGIGAYLVNGQIWGSSSFNDELKGELIVTEYTPNSRIEGTFHFYVQNIFTEEISHITDGEFNMPVMTLEN